MCIYEIYTDGSAIGQTPNYYGGWGVVILKNGEKHCITGSAFLEELGGRAYVL